jgi:hypothetical protein
MPVQKWGQELTLLTPSIEVHSFTVIGAIGINKVVALMTMNDSMDGRAFELFVEKFLVPNLWSGAVDMN